MMIKKIIRILIAGLIPLLLVTSCGNDSTAPDDGLIFITPDAFDLTTAAVVACPDTYPPAAFIVNSFQVSVLDRNGFVLPGLDIDILAIFSSNTGTTFQRLWLFDDEKKGSGNGDGSIMDATGTMLDDNELVSGVGDPTTYRTNTVYFVVHADGSCGFKGDIKIFSGKLSNVFSIDYKAI